MSGIRMAGWVWVAMGVAMAAAGCAAKPTAVDPAHADDATAEAIQRTAVETADALSKLDSAPAPTSAMAGTYAAEGADAAASGPYTITGGASEPEAVAAAAAGRMGMPVAIWFWEQGCTDCDAMNLAWIDASRANAGKVAFARVDTKDAAAADAVKRYRVTKTPAFVLFNTDGRPAASFEGWPGEATFKQYLAQAK